MVDVLEGDRAREAASGQAAHEDPEVDAAGADGARGAALQIGQGDVEVDHGAAEADDGARRRVERHVDPVVVPRRIGDEAHARVGPLDDALLGVLHRERHRIDDAALGQLEVAIPRGEPIAAPHA
jgi:hypothetical protein